MEQSKRFWLRIQNKIMGNEHTFRLKILTPDEKLFEGSVLSVVIPTHTGEITILKNHTPLITLISIGELKLYTGPTGVETESILVQGGVVDVKSSVPNPVGVQEFEVVILADLKLDIGTDNLDEEVERAKEAMILEQDEIDFALEEAIIERNLFLKRMKQK